MPPIQTLLLDLDGTLINLQETKIRFKFIFHTIRFWKPYGNLSKRFKTLRKVTAAIRDGDSSISNYERGVEIFASEMKLPSARARSVLEDTLVVVFPHLQTHFSPAVGAREFLTWARERFDLILATNPVWPASIVRRRMEWCGLDLKLFKAITHSERMHYCKPNPRFYKELMEQEVLTPERCFMVGNHPTKDGVARSLGIGVGLLSKEATPRKREALLWTGNLRAIAKVLSSFTEKPHTE